jgi:hypothetical protein
MKFDIFYRSRILNFSNVLGEGFKSIQQLLLFVDVGGHYFD